VDLAGIRVLDLTRLLPGAFCTMLLGDRGADIIKVEEPRTGDYMRRLPPLVDGQGVAFNALNRNKRAITLNLKSEEGRELFKGLVATADVVVEGVVDNRPSGYFVAETPRLVGHANDDLIAMPRLDRREEAFRARHPQAFPSR